MHIVFDSEDAAALRKSFALDEKLESEILTIEDDWSIGPLGVVTKVEKEIDRNTWLSTLGVQLLGQDPIQIVEEYLEKDPEERIIIWIAPNSRDVCGYFRLVSSLQSFKGKVYNIWLNNLPFINDKKQLFYPNFLKEIPPSEFVKAQKLQLEISPSTFETDPDEWSKLIKENDLLRITDGGKKVTGKPDDFFDKEINTLIQNDWQKAGRLLQSIKSKSKYHPSRVFLLWRLREMINAQKVDARGDWPATENFEVKKNHTDDLSVNSDE